MLNTVIEYCDGDRIEVDIPVNFSFKEGKIDTGYVIENTVIGQYVRIPSGYIPDGKYVRGFWISRYEISKGKDGLPLSIANAVPWTRIPWYDAEKVAQSVNGYLPGGDEYNRICMWLVETGAASFKDVFVAKSSKANHSNPFVMAKTGSNPEWMVNHLDNFFGNCFIWTSEKSELNSFHYIIRGGNEYPPACRFWAKPNTKSEDIGMRIVIR